MEQPVHSIVNIQKVQAHLRQYSSEVHPIVLGRAAESASELASIYQMLLSLHESMVKDIQALELHLSRPEVQSIRFAEKDKTGRQIGSIGNRIMDGRLSRREQEVLLLFAKGCSYHEVAEIFDCAIATIQTYVKRIYKKLKVHSRSEAIFEAAQMGIINLNT
jgi:DNA-binding CsgD family transcriptional regulator